MNAPKRILIVDDEPNVRLVFRTALEATGYVVSEAADGDAALAQLPQVADRSHPARPENAHRGWDGNSAPATRRGRRDSGGGHHGARQRARRGGGDEAGGSRFPTQAGQPCDVASRSRRSLCALPANQAAVKTPVAASASAHLFEEDLSRTRRAMERREYDDAEFFLRIADALKPGSQEVTRLRETLLSRKLHPEGFSFRALGDLLR